MTNLQNLIAAQRTAETRVSESEANINERRFEGAAASTLAELEAAHKVLVADLVVVQDQLLAVLED